MPRTDKAFKDLEKLWYNKLREAHFDDIEDSRTPELFLKSWHSTLLLGYDPEQFKAKQTYWECARALVHTYKFKNKLHKKIWVLYSEGTSIRDIMVHVNMKRWKVHSIIATIAREIV